jgi:two-component system cell cycle response regulator
MVLVVDDSDITRAILGRRLRQAGYEVVEAIDGVQGAVIALQTLPALVVTDLEMPVMDGCQLTRLLKNDPATASMPVVILTSHTEASSRFWGEDAGADAYVTKDELDDNLVPTVRGLLTGLRSASAAPQQAPPSGELEVLARVAQQLDRGLMEMTLVNRVLQIGMGEGSFGSAADTLLALVASLVDAELLAIGVVDEQGVVVQLRRPDGARTAADSERARDFVVERLGARGRELRDLRIDGREGDDLPSLDIDRALLFELPLREARGCLVVWPRAVDATVEAARDLLTKAAPHAALVLDNVRLAETLWRLSTRDELTGMLNHRAILNRLAEEVDRAQRYRRPLSVVLCDIDRFKAINDSFGHPTGDVVLRAVAGRMRAGMRSSDIAGRYGGEEFLFILPDTGLESARQATARLCEDLAGEPIETRTGRGAITVTASFGVACDGEVAGVGCAEGLLSLADTRLYEAKAAGRCCVKP